VLQFIANFLLSVTVKTEHQSTVDSVDKKSVSVFFMAQCIKKYTFVSIPAASGLAGRLQKTVE